MPYLPYISYVPAGLNAFVSYVLSYFYVPHVVSFFTCLTCLLFYLPYVRFLFYVSHVHSFFFFFHKHYVPLFFYVLWFYLCAFTFLMCFHNFNVTSVVYVCLTCFHYIPPYFLHAFIFIKCLKVSCTLLFFICYMIYVALFFPLKCQIKERRGELFEFFIFPGVYGGH